MVFCDQVSHERRSSNSTMWYRETWKKTRIRILCTDFLLVNLACREIKQTSSLQQTDLWYYWLRELQKIRQTKMLSVKILCDTKSLILHLQGVGLRKMRQWGMNYSSAWEKRVVFDPPPALCAHYVREEEKNVRSCRVWFLRLLCTCLTRSLPQVQIQAARRWPFLISRQ